MFQASKLQASRAWWALSQTLFEAGWRYYHNWRARAALRRLTDYDDRMLDDIGVTRGELHWALAQPLDMNAARLLEDRSRRRRRRELWRGPARG